MVKRTIPRWGTFAPLLQRRTGSSGLQRRLDSAVDIHDLVRLARRRAPRAVFDYVDGAASDEVSKARNADAFRRVEFQPRVLRDVENVSTTTTILGRESTMPFAFAPTGFTRMMHTEGEPAVARVAARAGIPYALSTVGTTSIEDVARASGDGRRWFQLYVVKDRERSRDMLQRARRNGFDVLVLTVDVPVSGARLRDARSGLSIPPSLTWRTFVNGAMHPAWLFDFLTTPPPNFETMGSGDGVPTSTVQLGTTSAAAFDSSVSYDDLAWFRDVWQGTVVVKGIQRVDDAVRCADLGVDGIVVSNHGGRQLDRSIATLELLPEVVAAVGSRTEVLVDSGVRSGADVVAALALGARGVLVGRAYLYGLMAGGEAGVQRVFDLLAQDVRRSMQLLGVNSIAELSPAANPGLVRLRSKG
jgi:L-lactate dehydrogenase (cytochrome)